MARGLNQFEVGSVADAEKVTGTSSTPPGNDQKINDMLGDLKLRNRKQPLSMNVQTSIVRQVKSDASTDYTKYVMFRVYKDCTLVSAEIHVREVYSTTGFPEVEVEGYAVGSSAQIAAGTGPTMEVFSGALSVSVVPTITVQAITVNESQDSGLPNGLVALPIENDFFSAGSVIVIRMKPPAYNGSSVEGWKLANVNLQFAEFHQS